MRSERGSTRIRTCNAEVLAVRVSTRVAMGLVTLLPLLLLAAGPVLAGGSATVVVDEGSAAPPVVGEERAVIVELLQHGVTPVTSGTTTLTAVHPTTGDSVSAEAEHVGAGRWSASMTFPADGEWMLTVLHSELATPGPLPLTIMAPAASLAAGGTGWLAPALAVIAFAIISAGVVIATVRVTRRTSRDTPDTVSAGG